MKTLIFLALLATNIGRLTAQSSFDVIEEPLPYNHKATSFTTDIIGLNENFVMYYWQKFIEDHKGMTYVKSVEKGNVQLQSVHVQFPFLNNHEVTMYSRCTPNKTESGVLLTIWVKQKDGSFYSSKNNEASAEDIDDWLLKFNQSLETLEEKLISG